MRKSARIIYTTKPNPTREPKQEVNRNIYLNLHGECTTRLYFMRTDEICDMRWTLKPKPETEAVRELSEAIKVSHLLATLLLQRGVKTYEDALRFFRPQLSHLHDPFLMKDMDLAVSRIEQAVREGQNILVYGDYDVDGTSAVSLVSSYLLTYYPNVATYIPDRYSEGYGVSFAGIDFAHDNDIQLIIALDCGIKAVDKVAYARQKGIDFIICDHHRPGEVLPEAVAVLDPKRTDCSYPYDELCGCGIGFKLIQALEQNAGRPVDGILSYLDLVATAIAADIVPITGENRVLTFYGLKVINRQSRPGIRAILNTVKKSELNVTDVVFIIAPRINAAGRMEHGRYAVSLLTETDLGKAEEMGLSKSSMQTGVAWTRKSRKKPCCRYRKTKKRSAIPQWSTKRAGTKASSALWPPGLRRPITDLLWSLPVAATSWRLLPVL